MTSARASRWTTTCGAKTRCSPRPGNRWMPWWPRAPIPWCPIATWRPAAARRRGSPPTSIARRCVVPPPVRGGALLLHGLTDAPYSMRAMAERLQAAGFVTLSLRMQGHGTVPGGLVGVTLGRLGRRRAHGGASRARGDRPGPAARDRRLFERRRAGRQLRPRRPRRRAAGGPDGAGAGVADDRRVTGGAARSCHQPAGAVPVLREGPLARRRPRVQPVQVQFVPGQCRAADGAVHGRDSRPADPRGRRGPARRVSAGAGVSVGGRHHGEHAGRGEPALQPVAGRGPRTGALRPQSDVGCGGVHQAGCGAATPHRATARGPSR